MGRRGPPKKFDGKLFVRVPKEVETWIKQRAKEEDREISEFVRLMLTRWYQAEELKEETLIIGVTPWGSAPTLESLLGDLARRVNRIEEQLDGKKDGDTEPFEPFRSFRSPYVVEIKNNSD